MIAASPFLHASIIAVARSLIRMPPAGSFNHQVITSLRVRAYFGETIVIAKRNKHCKIGIQIILGKLE